MTTTHTPTAPSRLNEMTDEQVEALSDDSLVDRYYLAIERCKRYQSSRSRGYRRASAIRTQALRALHARGIVRPKLITFSHG